MKVASSTTAAPPLAERIRLRSWLRRHADLAALANVRVRRVVGCVLRVHSLHATPAVHPDVATYIPYQFVFFVSSEFDFDYNSGE